MKKKICLISVIILMLPVVAVARDIDARTVIARAWDYMRGTTSVSVVEMTVHRPDWERKSTIKAWTRGRESSIFRIIAPKKDKGNGTLKLGKEMWTYNPKINRVVKIPPSMMSQSWMGSDFSNNDLSKADSIITDYSHDIVGSEEHGGMKVYVIKAMPKPEAPVIWGMQMLKIREDGILMSQAFHDEDLEVVKVLTTTEIIRMGGRLFPRIWTMRSFDLEPEDSGSDEDAYTRLEYESLEFDVVLNDRQFEINALKKPMR